MGDMDENCLFCKIVAGEIPADVVAESEHTVAFRDINPQAPTHVLVIPRRHEPNIASLADAAPLEAAELLTMTRQVANDDGSDDYRLVFNNGPGALQTVFHCHGHVIAGRDMNWPPG